VANLLFYLLSAGAVAAAIAVIASRNPVVSVISLLGSFFCVAAIYLLAGFQFLAAVQIAVYVGAIMVLFLFVIMLLNLGDIAATERSEPMFHHGRRAVAAVATAVALLVVTLIGILGAELPAPTWTAPSNGLDQVNELALSVFSTYVLPFEAASVLLLATAIGVMVLAKRQRPTQGASREGQGGPAS
jgi:NADH-quinone oxidoreductase subunit J